MALLAPPVNVQVVDFANDRGNQIDVSWEASADVETGRVLYYRIFRSTHPDTGFAVVGLVGFTQTTYTDAGMDNDTDYYYRVAAGEGERDDDRYAFSPTVGPVSARPQWINYRQGQLPDRRHHLRLGHHLLREVGQGRQGPLHPASAGSR